MGYFEVDTNLDTMTVDFREIDIQQLVDRIQERYYKLREKSSDDRFLCVVTLEEWRALQYYSRNYPPFNISKVRVPIQRLLINNGLKSQPYLGMIIFGLQLIGSDLIGELSPLLL